MIAEDREDRRGKHQKTNRRCPYELTARLAGGSTQRENRRYQRKQQKGNGPRDRGGFIAGALTSVFRVARVMSVRMRVHGSDAG
jgi:hypothetical protein